MRGAPRVEPLSRRITITDVAKLCGVTPATVSRVLNGKKHFSASEAVRQKIVETARKLGYVPDLAARNLHRRDTHIIGLFASPRKHAAEVIDESLIEGLTEMLHAGGYDVFFELSAANRQKEALPFWRFDGAVLMQSPKIEAVIELDRRRVPYVCINERVGDPVAFVLADDAMGMKQAVAHLHQLGHKRLAYANARAMDFSHYSVVERYETLLAEVRTRSMELAPGHDTPFTSAAEFLNAGVQSGGATAVITYDHHIAVMLVGAAHGLGLRIPEDFSLICFNDAFPVALLPTPLTAVAVSGGEMGRIAADILLSELNGGSAPPSKEIRVAEDLVIRASTASPKAKG
jgi:LacI family transcriptional regulator